VRRKDREVTDVNEIIGMIEKCDVCRLAMIDHDKPYIVPMNFGFRYDDGTIILFFHCANEGRKIDVLKANPNVCFEMDCSLELIAGSTDCSCSMAYESVIGNGKVEFIEGAEAKTFALTQIMKKYTDRTTFEFDENVLTHLCAFQVVVSDLTGKRHSR
jgi:uncharacterized protein